MTTISVPGSGPSSDKITANLEKIAETCPHAPANYRHIAASEIEAEGLHEARLRNLETMLEEARDLENRAARIQEDGRLTEADEDQIEKLSGRAYTIKRNRHALQQKKLPPRFKLETLDKAIAKIQPHHTFVPALTKVPDDPDKAMKLLQRVRDGRGDLLEIRRKIEFAPLPIDVVERLAVEQISGEAKKGRPNISEPFRVQEHKGQRGRIRWASHFVHTPFGGRNEPDAWATFCWLHEKTLKARIIEMLQERAPEGALTLEERPAKLAEIDAQLDALEYEEEALIRVIEASGKYKVARRPEANPFAVLQIKRGKNLELPKRAKAQYGEGGDGASHGVPVTQTRWAASAGGRGK